MSSTAITEDVSVAAHGNARWRYLTLCVICMIIDVYKRQMQI